MPKYKFWDTKKETRRAKQNSQIKKLEDFVKQTEAAAAADLSVTKWALAHNVAPNAMQGPYLLAETHVWKTSKECTTFLHSHVSPKNIQRNATTVATYSEEPELN